MSRAASGRGLLLLALTTGCALVAGLDEFGPPATGGAPTTGGGEPTGGAGATGGEGASSNTGGGGSPCAADLFITEVRTAGPNGGSDELVEIFNPTPVAVSLADLRVVGKPLTSLDFNDKWQGAPMMLASMEWVVIGGPTYSGDPLPEELELEQSFGDDQVIALVRVDGANSTELDRLSVCCAEACGEFPDATLNPACDASTGDPVPSLHRQPACAFGALVPGPPTPYEAAP